MTIEDPYAALKAVQKESWGLFAPLATFTTVAAASLVSFAGVQPGQRVLDVGCGTGVVALTAALRRALVDGLDLSATLLAEAREQAAAHPGCSLAFQEGDAEALPWPSEQFDVVLSQFGHMFAPRPAVVTAEMLRVLKPGGRIAFSTWPPELLFGRLFGVVDAWIPPPPGIPSTGEWGSPPVIRDRLGSGVRDVEFDRDEMRIPALSPAHFRGTLERNAAPFLKLVQALSPQPERLAEARAEIERVISPYFAHNQVRQAYLMTRATKC